MPASDPNTRAHLEWLGYIQPHGLVVSPPALLKAGAFVNRQDAHRQALLAGCAEERELAPGRQPIACIRDFREFAGTVLGWGFSPRGYAGFTAETPIPEELTLPLPDYGETLRPDFAVRERDPANGDSPWQLLVQVLAAGQEFDRPAPGRGGLDASAQGRAERLLRATGVRAGVLVNGVALRLISAPHGESSGWMDFRFADLLTTAGRPLCSALHLLLSEQRLLALPRHERLTAVLADSRLYQNEVSERLAEQVLHALYELVRGFQNAHAATDGALLSEPLAAGGDRNAIYRGLLTVILRLVFLLYAEERGLLPKDATFARHYLLGGLYRRLRKDAAAHPDTMDQRYGAWAQLVVLFRLLHDGIPAGGGGAVSLPERRGALFDPDRYRFLEGRSGGGSRQRNARLEPPRVSDGVVYRVLEKLLVLDGERLSYRTLDVEQIGSVYETIMGFRLETATGRSLAVKPAKKLGAPTTIDLDALLAQPPGRRGRWLQERADRPVSASVAKGLRAARTVNDLHAALDRVLDHAATPDLVPRGGLVLQPNEERRRSGSHYTPRELTEPIVRHTLAPLLERLRGEDGRAPRPEQVLDLKICDPAMGSGAFLVETCRQLADALIKAWGAHGAAPEIPPDEDEVTFARRLVAQKCLYGIDRNPMAVDLAKVSLWLSTLARDHPFTFVDHAFRRGDSLVGLTRRQIEALHWQGGHSILAGFGVREKLAAASELRRLIREADDTVTDLELQRLWRRAQEALAEVRRFGDLTLAAFFEGSKPKERAARREAYQHAIQNWQSQQHAAELAARRNAEVPFAPFHWEIEFPEVFERANPGFDGFVGNPPFAGKNNVAAGNVAGYPSWLKELHAESHGNADLVAHFYRRAFDLLRGGGAFGLIATNTIAQGDTRSSGLRWICEHGGHIYRATKRVKWPGDAAVVVSVVHVAKGEFAGKRMLDRAPVDRITAFLFHRGGHADPVRLAANAGKSFQGSIVLGMGFTFDDTDRKGVASPLAEMRRLIDQDPRNREVIFPYVGGEEVNTSPTHTHHRYVINFGERSEAECRRGWPDLMAIVEERVKPERAKLTRNTIGRKRAKFWWHYGSPAKELYGGAIAGLDRVLANSQISTHLQFAFLPFNIVYAHRLYIYPFQTYAPFCALQSRPHEIWARFFGSSLEDRLCYTPTDCFDTFPFPEGWDTHPALEAAGKAYYEYRAALMVDNGEGMTKTYNRFHDLYETDPRIAELRELHAAMDRAVLDAYGWSDIPTDCDLLLDYEIHEASWGRKKKPYRWRWPDEVRDEVLARLLSLNANRAAAEARAGIVAVAGSQLPVYQAAALQPLRNVDESQSSYENLMAKSILKRAEQVKDYVDRVRQLADDHRDQFTFLPKEAYADYANRGNLWVIIDTVSLDLLGYLLLGGQYPRMKVFQICVHPDHRWTGIARMLISELIRYSTEDDYLNITARVSSRLEANKFWQRSGFHIIKQTKEASGTIINLYSLNLDVPSLFNDDEPTRSSRDHAALRIDPRRPLLHTPSYVIDLNVFFDVLRRRDRGQAAQIMALSLDHTIRLSVTREFVKELERASHDLNDDPILTLAKQLPTLPVRPDRLHYVIAELQELLASTLSEERRWTTNDISDQVHLASSIYHKAFGFITRDSTMLRHSESIYKRYGLRVLSPDDVLDSFEPDHHRAIHAPMSISEISVSNLNNSDPASVDQFLQHHGSQEQGLSWWRSAITENVLPEPLIVSSAQQIVGIGLWTGTSRSRSDAVLHLLVDEYHPDSDLVIDHILSSSANIGKVGRVWRFNLQIPKKQIKTRETALKRGFQSIDNDTKIEFARVVVKRPIVSEYWPILVKDFLGNTGLGLSHSMPNYQELDNTGIVLSREGAPTLWPMSLFDFETFLSPGLLIAPHRGAVIVPIKQGYADELLPEARDQKLLVSQHDAAFRLERAYFLKAQKCRIMPQGTLIVFYVSGKRGEAVALARVTYCQTLTTTQAALNLRRQGVLSEQELKDRATRSGKVTAVTFDNVLAFPYRINFRELKDLKCVGGANLVTAQKISHGALERIVDVAFGADC